MSTIFWIVVILLNLSVRGDDGKLFFMYDLPETYWWRWPVDDADCSNNGYVSHEHKEYSGLGKLLVPDEGLFLSWHGGLFSALYNRMKRSSRRTLDPEKASMFVIPYDLALDGYLDAGSCRRRRQCSQGLAKALMTNISSTKYYQRSDGADHVLLWSLGQFHPWPIAGCDKLIRNFCWKCTITCYWMDSSRLDRFVSVPFSASYHWWEGIKTVPWDMANIPKRNLTAVYLGSTQTLNPTNTKMRRSLTTQCANAANCHWFKLGHSSKDTNIADLLSVYARSVFCLCPPGDDPTRKAVMDIVISGCIPVFFEYSTLYNQHPWHLTEQDVLDFSVYIPGWMIKTNHLNIMTVLNGISPEVIRKKQQVLAGVAPRLQYAMPPPERLLDRYDNATWDPPFKDGVELTLDGMFARVDNVLHNRSTGIPLKFIPNWEWNAQYDNVRIVVPNITNEKSAAWAEQDKLMKQGMWVNQIDTTTPKRPNLYAMPDNTLVPVHNRPQQQHRLRSKRNGNKFALPIE